MCVICMWEPCRAWRQTFNCNNKGEERDHENDLSCSDVVKSELSGYCECSNGLKVQFEGCGHDEFTCAQKCWGNFFQ